MTRRHLINLLCVGLVCFMLGSALQFVLFEKELWVWGVRKDQRALQVRIDQLERQDLRTLLDTLEEHGAEIERALLVLGWHQLEDSKKKPKENPNERP